MSMFKQEAQAQAADFAAYAPFPVGDREHADLPDDLIVSLSAREDSDSEIHITLATKSLVIGPLRLTRVAAEKLSFELRRIAVPLPRF